NLAAAALRPCHADARRRPIPSSSAHDASLRPRPHHRDVEGGGGSRRRSEEDLIAPPRWTRTPSSATGTPLWRPLPHSAVSALRSAATTGSVTVNVAPRPSPGLS